MKVVSFASIFVMSTSPCAADLMLKVDFDSATPGVQDSPQLDANGRVTASILLFLTGGETLYDYYFGVRYDSAALSTFGNVDTYDTPPVALGFVEVVTVVDISPGFGEGFLGAYNEIRDFDGYAASETLTEAHTANGVVLGQLVFTPLIPLNDPSRLIVMPGAFRVGKTVDIPDIFVGLDGRIPSERLVFVGNNGIITAVPEPSSIFLVTCASMALLFHWTKSCRLQRLQRLFRLG